MHPERDRENYCFKGAQEQVLLVPLVGTNETSFLLSSHRLLHFLGRERLLNARASNTGGLVVPDAGLYPIDWPNHSRSDSAMAPEVRGRFALSSS